MEPKYVDREDLYQAIILEKLGLTAIWYIFLEKLLDGNFLSLN